MWYTTKFTVQDAQVKITKVRRDEKSDNGKEIQEAK